MSLSIIHIPNPLLRRIVLILTFPLFLPLAIVIGGLKGSEQWVRDLLGAWKNAWTRPGR